LLSIILVVILLTLWQELLFHCKSSFISSAVFEAATELVMRVLIIIVPVLLFQKQFVLAAYTRTCLCPQTDNLHATVGFCGNEIIELRASDNPSTRICNPRNVYKCMYGPNKSTLEIPCTENQTCSPGSPEYHKLRKSRGKNLLDASHNHSRFCVTNEGKNTL